MTGQRRNMQQIARLGGLSLKSKPAPAEACPCCGRTFKSHLAYIGHRGMVATAARYFNGNVTAAARQLAYNALAALDRGNSWDNGAFTRKYKPIKPTDPARRIAELKEDYEHTKAMLHHAATPIIKEAARKSLILIEAELLALGESI